MKTFWALVLFAFVASAQEIVNVDGRNVRIRVEGIGSPAVIFESGFGGDGVSSWTTIDANVYDSLAEAHVAKGALNAALANYRKALETDPTNTNAAAWIARLEKESPR